MGGYAWVTLATNDSYSLGALVLAHSLKEVGTTQHLVVLVTPGVTNAMREKLSSVFNLVQEVNILDSKDETNLRLLKRPELGVTFTKLHCWRLTQFDKCVFLDADTLVLQNCDELFDREELSAAPDVGWPDCFNSGVFVYRPSNETYEKLVQLALEKGSFDGGDQGLLNLYFSDWAHKDISKHLPFIYNMCSTACYSYLPAFKQFGGDAKIIHFIGPAKPWLQYFNTETKQVRPSGSLQHLEKVLQRWWDIFCSVIYPSLTRDMTGIAGAFAQLTLGAPRTAEQSALDDHLRRQGWEVGNIDYLGKDSFENIWSKISTTLSSNGAPSPSAVVPAAVPVAVPVATPVAVPAPDPAPAPSQTKEPTSPPIEVKPKEQVAEAPKPETLPPQTVAPQTPPVPKEAVSVPAAEAPVCPLPPKLEETPATPELVQPQPISASPIIEAAQCPLLPKPVAPEPAQAAPISPTVPVAAPLPSPTAEVVACPLPPKEKAPEVPAPEASKAAPPAEVPKPETTPQPQAATVEPVPPQIPPAGGAQPPTPLLVQEAPKPQTPPVEASKPQTPPAVEAPKPQTPPVQASKPQAPPVEAPKPQTPPVEAPKPQTPPVEAPKPQTPTDAVVPKPQVPPAVEAPKPQAAPTETPKPQTPVAQAPESAKSEQSPVEAVQAKEEPKAVPEPVKETPTAKPVAEPQPAGAAAAGGPAGPTPPPRKGSGGGPKKSKAKK